uniref:Uncharacterized protein n=1 Tax=Manihot esculenta TaxID=3983 RepID=A0A2C9UH31_MANES
MPEESLLWPLVVLCFLCYFQVNTEISATVFLTLGGSGVLEDSSSKLEFLESMCRISV